MNLKLKPENWLGITMSFNGVSNSLCELRDEAEKLGDETLLKLIEECSEVDNKIFQYLDEKYGWE